VPIVNWVFSGSKNIVGNLGILSTPVIDPSTNVMSRGGHARERHAGVSAARRRHHDRRRAVWCWRVDFGQLRAAAVGDYVGWVMAYDKQTLQQSGIFATVPTAAGQGGGVWQSGRPPVVDSAGHVYVFVGNAYGCCGYDGVNNFSESVLKLDPAWPQAAQLVHARQLERPGRRRPRPLKLRPAADPGHGPARRRRQEL